MIKIIQNKKDIGAEIICDLIKLSNLDFKKIKSALNKYGVIYFKKQNLTSGSYVKFAKKFGKLANYPIQLAYIHVYCFLRSNLLFYFFYLIMFFLLKT